MVNLRTQIIPIDDGISIAEIKKNINTIYLSKPDFKILTASKPSFVAIS